MHKVYLSLGGNIGNKDDNFLKVHDLISQEIGQIIKASSIYETPPWGFHSEDNFWNEVILIKTNHSPEIVINKINEIENIFGRERSKKNYISREMDIDILYFDEMFMETETLIIPHPLIQQRKFVLVPLVEIAPDYKHPLLRLTNFQLLENCHDKSVTKKVK